MKKSPIIPLKNWQEILSLDAKSRIFVTHFSLNILDYCVHYDLYLEGFPEDTQVTIGTYTIDIQISNNIFRADVTEFVTLDDNEIQIVMPAGTAIGAVYLKAVPCE